MNLIPKLVNLDHRKKSRVFTFQGKSGFIYLSTDYIDIVQLSKNIVISFQSLESQGAELDRCVTIVVTRMDYSFKYSTLNLKNRNSYNNRK